LAFCSASAVRSVGPIFTRHGRCITYQGSLIMVHLSRDLDHLQPLLLRNLSILRSWSFVSSSTQVLPPCLHTMACYCGRPGVSLEKSEGSGGCPQKGSLTVAMALSALCISLHPRLDPYTCL